MKESSLVHVKVEHNEAIEAKKDLLSLEIDFINIIRDMREYKKTRLKGLKSKNKLKRMTSSVLTKIRRIQGNLPKIKINHIPGKKIRDVEEKITEKSSRDIVLEKELRDIQEKLMALQR